MQLRDKKDGHNKLKDKSRMQNEPFGDDDQARSQRDQEELELRRILEFIFILSNTLSFFFFFLFLRFNLLSYTQGDQIPIYLCDIQSQKFSQERYATQWTSPQWPASGITRQWPLWALCTLTSYQMRCSNQITDNLETYMLRSWVREN